MKSRQSIYIGLGFLSLGLLLGKLFFGGGNTPKIGEHQKLEPSEHQHEVGEVWTCSMHPQIRQPEPGQCPICGMDLVSVAGTPGGDTGSSVDLEGVVQMTPAAMQIANVQTVLVKRANPTKELYLSGRVEVDERRISEITAHFDGRIEKLYVNYTGQEVKKGQVLASVYSPDLVTAQKELFEAASFRETNPSFFEAAVNKLKLWDLSDRQIENILESNEVRYNFNVLAPRSGTIVSRHVNAGDHIHEGQSMFEVAGLDKLWVLFDAYESDLPWIQVGNEIRFTVQSLPGKTFISIIAFVNPVVEAERRVVEVRAEIQNELGQLKPDMYVQGVLPSSLPDVDEVLLVPKTAILWTGKRSVIYVKQPNFEEPTFTYREVTLGSEAGNNYIVEEGLEEGEEIVVNGVFKIDAAAQLQGKVSMMNPEGNKSSAGHNHGEMSMSGESSRERPITSDNFGKVPPQFKQQLAAIVVPYLELKNSLVDSSEKKASSAAKQTRFILGKVDMSLLSEVSHNWWMEHFNTIQQALTKIQSAPLEAQRKAFAPLSEALYRSLQQFNVTGLDTYYQYCPMADNNAGAYWLSKQQEIRNPYFGESMLSCGETLEILK
ncbi:MAG: efflux RND transporter periplasmic adaptor subunit [Bacteroidota bacterium]